MRDQLRKVVELVGGGNMLHRPVESADAVGTSCRGAGVLIAAAALAPIADLATRNGGALSERVVVVADLVAVAALAGLWLRSRRHRRVAGPDGQGEDAACLVPAGQTTDASSQDMKVAVRNLLEASETMRVALQPVIDLRDGHVVGVEALARFADGRSPADWFAEAHDVGLGPELEIRAVARALEVAPPGRHISLNLSPSTLAHKDLAGALTARPDLDIVLELTEHAVVDDYDALVERLQPLRDMGIRVAVDDAGSGYASMRHILSLRPDLVKLDRSLISQIHNDPARRALAESLVDFARKIGADLVAEGIEVADELVACQDLGIVYAQGYLLGRPEIVDASHVADTTT
jgi:EAL domain-containing protein (putative c-di-GMP-specific phosphodiesterase class I)